MKIRIAALISIIAVVVFAGCRKTASEPQPSASATPLAQEETAPLGGTAQAGQKYFFRGTIANLSIEMQLVRDGEYLSGTYFYPKVGKNISHRHGR